MSTIVRTKVPDFAAVKRLARKVLEENFIIKPPIFASELAEAYGIEVLEAEFKPEYVHVAGLIDFSKKKILLNADDSAAHRNFTTAHELGHYLLNHNESDDYTVLLRNPDAMVKTPIEQEANCFAAYVLVPEPLLREYLENYPYITDQELSIFFAVPANIIRYRKLYLT